MKERQITASYIKLIGFIALTLSNVAFSGLFQNLILQCVLGILGGSALPIFAFLITEGYRKTHNMNRYMLRILLSALLAAYPYRCVFFPYTSAYDARSFFSAGLTAFFCLGALVMYDKMKTKNQRLFCVVFILAMSLIIQSDWLPFALVLTFLFHFYREKQFSLLQFYVVGFCVLYAGFNILFLISGSFQSGEGELIRNISLLGCILPLPLLKRYNGERGRKVKWLSYLFYPFLLFCLLFLKIVLVDR